MDNEEESCTNEREKIEIENERISVLEAKVNRQDQEILGLRSQVNDLERKITELVESNSKKTNNLVKSPKGRPPFKPLPSKFEPSRKSFDNFKKPTLPSKSVKQRPSTSRPRTVSRSSDVSSSGRNLRRSSSSLSINQAGGDNQSRNKRRSSVIGKGGPVYSEVDGTVKMYLKGRPVVLHKPDDVANYSLDTPSQMPDKKLQLDWVYGYRGKDCRSNIHVIESTDEIVYFAAAVVVLYNVKNHTQRHYNMHNDDVKSLAVHPDQSIVASGQVAGLELDGREYKGSSSPIKPRIPAIHIWSVSSLQTLHILTGFNRSVACISFSVSDGGKHLAAVDESNDHVLSVWLWNKEKKITEQKSSKDPVFVAEFNPNDNTSIVTCGKSHVSFWTVRDEKLNKKTGLFEKNEKPKFVLCAAFRPNGELLTGDNNGNVQVWCVNSRTIKQVVQKIHSGPVFGIKSMQDGSFISTGKDGFLKKFDENLISIAEKQITEHPCRVVAFSPTDSTVYVGTRKNTILMGNIEDGETFNAIVQSHNEELWGLECSPRNGGFFTAGYDKQLFYFDSEAHKVVWLKQMDEAIQSIGMHPTEDKLLVAMKNGKWLLADVTDGSFDVITQQQDGNEQHDIIKFSPDGKYISVGSHDNCIYLYKYEEGVVLKVGKCSGHSSYVTHLDWSSDSSTILSNSGDYEVLAWDASNCKQITSASSLRNIQWHTQTCTLGFNVIGIWPEGADGTDINSCSRSRDNQMLCSGDDFGKVHLFKYPVVQPQSVNQSATAHCSHVTNVQFLNEDLGVVSTGGQDCSVMQWKLV